MGERGSDVEDRGVPGFQEQRDEIAAHEVNAVEIDRDQLVPFLGRELRDRRNEIVAGIVDHRLRAPPFAGNEIAQTGDIGLLSDVGDENFRLAAMILN